MYEILVNDIVIAVAANMNMIL